MGENSIRNEEQLKEKGEKIRISIIEQNKNTFIATVQLNEESLTILNEYAAQIHIQLAEILESAIKSHINRFL